MVSERNRILNLIEYFETLGIQVNLGKNKARGNKGLFKVKGELFRIDIAKGQTDEIVLKTLIHEFAHFLHYKNDKTLSSLDFIIKTSEEVILDELINLTVDSIPKSSVEPFFALQSDIKKEIKNLINELKQVFPDFSNSYKYLETKIKKTPLKYLLKYDKVKVCEGFSTKFYSIDSLDDNSDITLYLKLKSKQRALKRINSKISRLNKYYNSTTELFARGIEAYFTNANTETKAPIFFNCCKETIDSNRIPMLNDLAKIINS